MLVGCPGSGKSTFASKERFKDYKRISYDDVRHKVLDSEKTGIYYLKEIEPEVTNYSIAKLRLAIVKKEDIIIDSTNLTRESRDKKLKYIPKDYHVNFFIMPRNLEWSLKNNKKRKRQVDDIVMKQMYYSYEPVAFVGNHYSFSYNIHYLDLSDF
jgi:predicted kinase